MTSPILPDYVPVPRAPRSALRSTAGATSCRRVERNLYWITDGDYHPVFLTTRERARWSRLQVVIVGSSEPRSVAGRVTVLYRRAGRAGQSRLGLALLVIADCQLMVLMDTTIVTMALPRIQSALGFSATGLLWVVNLYGLIFGGLLLLGGRVGEILGRRRVLIAGLVLFSAASLLGGVAQDEGWLLAARAAQGTGAALIAPAALALIITNFPQGPQRSRATSVYAAVSALAAAVGLVAGGLLVTYASWRWTLIVTAPAGIALALAAPLVLTGKPALASPADSTCPGQSPAPAPAASQPWSTGCPRPPRPAPSTCPTGPAPT